MRKLILSWYKYAQVRYNKITKNMFVTKLANPTLLENFAKMLKLTFLLTSIPAKLKGSSSSKKKFILASSRSLLLPTCHYRPCVTNCVLFMMTGKIYGQSFRFLSVRRSRRKKTFFFSKWMAMALLNIPLLLARFFRSPLFANHFRTGLPRWPFRLVPAKWGKLFPVIRKTMFRDLWGK